VLIRTAGEKPGHGRPSNICNLGSLEFAMSFKKLAGRPAPIARKRSRARTRAWNSRPMALSLWKRRWAEKHPL